MTQSVAVWCLLPRSAAKRKGTVHLHLVYKTVFCILDVYVSTIMENRMVFFNRETMWASNMVKGRLRLFICDYDLNPTHISKIVTKTETSLQSVFNTHPPSS